VYCKGAITHTFTHSRGRDSETIAAAWANEWRKDDPKKRGMSRILFSAPGLDDFSVVAESLDEIAASKTRKAKSHDATIEDLKRMKLQNPRQNPDWRAWFGIAKKKGGEASAAAVLAGRRAAHEAKILAVKAQIAAERSRYRQAYNVLDLTYAEIADAAERKDKRAIDAEYDLIAHVTGVDDGDWKPNRTFALSRLKKTKAGFFGLESQLDELQRTRPNPRRLKWLVAEHDHHVLNHPNGMWATVVRGRFGYAVQIGSGRKVIKSFGSRFLADAKVMAERALAGMK
jgi:hypothetical protein